MKKAYNFLFSAVVRVLTDNLLWVLLALVCTAQTSYAQTPCDRFPQYLKEGDQLFAQNKFWEAVQKYNTAMIICPEKATQAQAKVKVVFDKIEGLKNEAEKAKSEAEKAKAAVQAQLDQIRKKDQLQLSTYADNVGKALARYDISEARREMEKIRQTQIAPKDLLTRLEKQITDTVQTLLPDMVKVEGGTFLMGCDSTDKCGDDETQHQVTLSTYQIGKYEVTQALWQKVMGSNPSYFQPSNGKDACPTCPVEQVSWNDIQVFIEKLNEKTGKTYRLPTEAEWEYAARGGKQSKAKTPLSSGGAVHTEGQGVGHLYAGTTEAIDDYAWYIKNSDNKTQPVGTKKPNELGIYDMSGNVYEWCSDWYGNYPTDPQTNPKGAETGSIRVLRGGSWGGDASGLRVAVRSGNDPTDSNDFIGFRLAMD
jgi:formylglycine-generating enzyme required for sulfatase activity